MDQSEITAFVTGLRNGVEVTVASAANDAPETAWGDSFFFYDPDGAASDQQFPFVTIVTQDYEGWDTESHLDRPGVYRVNAWVSRETFARLFGDDDRTHDFTALDTPIPHPVSGAQSWVSVLNPGPRSSELTRALLAEALERAVTRHERAKAREGGGRPGHPD